MTQEESDLGLQFYEMVTRAAWGYEQEEEGPNSWQVLRALFCNLAGFLGSRFGAEQLHYDVDAYSCEQSESFKELDDSTSRSDRGSNAEENSE